MTGEYGLLDEDAVEGTGDEWESIDISETAEDRVAKRRDREFNVFRKRLKDADQFKVEQSVFDDATLAALYRLVQHGYIDAIGGPISTGKEANVYAALGGDETTYDEVAVKVYRISASDFKQMREYLVGDPRFEGIRNDKKEIVIAWTRKEFANLIRAKHAGVRVPEPIAVERNILVMEYIETDGERAKRLSEVHVENPEIAFEVVQEYMARLYRSGLIHGDLSEYNIVFHDGQLVFLDLGQAVTVHHPNASEFLRRDCRNIVAFFNRLGYEVTTDDLYSSIVDEVEE